VGDYLDALGRFRGMAVQQFGSDGTSPNLTVGFGASMLRYLKARLDGLDTKTDCEPWQGVGDGLARTPWNDQLAPAARDRLWSWASCVCEALDERGVPFQPVKPNPRADYDALRKSLGNPPVARTVTDPDTGQPYVERDDEDGPAADPADIYVDPSLEPTAVKPKPKKPPTAGDKLNTGLFLVAVIVIASIFHRR
jgi:hypothetical protein